MSDLRADLRVVWSRNTWRHCKQKAHGSVVPHERRGTMWNLPAGGAAAWP